MKLRQARNWCVNEAPFFILAVVFFGLQLATFAYQFNAILTDPSIKVVRSLLGLTLAVSRAAAYVLNWLCALILLPVLNKTLTRLRGASLGRFLYLERNIQVHIAFGWSIIWWVTVHVVGHFFNYLQLSVKLKIGTAEKALFFNYMDDFFKMGSPESYSLRTGPGVTGYVALIALFLMVTAAIPKVKEAKYEIFWIAHHLMFIFYFALVLHGQFCFIQADPNKGYDKCRGGPKSFLWIAIPGAMYLGERLARLIQAHAFKAKIIAIVQHPSKVVEVRFQKGGLHAIPGQYILICCPSISSIQWHPFTLTSAPHEDYLSIHVDILGDWTREFAKRVGCDYGNSMNTKALSTEEMPLIRVVGGYGTPFVTKDVFKHDAVVLVGAGIGVTPCVSILKTLWEYHINFNSTNRNMRKVYFYWICRDRQCFEWFQTLLSSFEERGDPFIEIRIYLTEALNTDTIRNVMINDDMLEDAVTRLRSQTNYGRPNWDKEFVDISKKHKGAKVGVFYCGNKTLATVLHNSCNQFSGTNGVKFSYTKETIV